MSHLADVVHIVCVASGKGGVGKSTTATNLALALQASGFQVGLLDADIYGPSLPAMLGVPDGTRPKVIGQKEIEPIRAHGLATASIGYLADRETAMVWRAPMIVGAFQQILTQTRWGKLDYLIVDLPPGTGDIQLSLSQQVKLTGAVIVTTPQDIALLDAEKAVRMFEKVNVPILGVIENMSLHVCSECGHESHIFGEGGGEQLARRYGAAVIGQLPLDVSIRHQGDAGVPVVLAAPESHAARCYMAAATELVEQINASASTQSQGGPTLHISDD